MEEKFDYAKAVEELEKIAAKVEDPATKLDDIDALVARSNGLLKACRAYLRKLDDIDALVARSNGLLKACRAYLRTVQERIDKLDEE